MNKVFLMLLSVVLLGSCGEKKGQNVKAPTRVKTQVVSPGMMDNAQTYVGIVEEHEATAVSFTGMGVVKRLLVNEGQTVARGQLIAPVSGIIGKKLIGAGETALPSQAVVSILDISTVKVKVAVPEAEIGGINASTPTSLTVEATGGSYHGGRIEKGVQADALTHTYDIRINVANGDRKLLPGMVANVRFVSDGSQAIGSMMIPVTAVQKTTVSTSRPNAHHNSGSGHFGGRR